VEWSGVEWSGLSDDHHRSIGMNINVVVYLSAPLYNVNPFVVFLLSNPTKTTPREKKKILR